MEYSKTRNMRISLKRGMRGQYLKKRISKIHFVREQYGYHNKTSDDNCTFPRSKRYKNVLQRRVHPRAICLVVSLAVIQYVQYHRLTKGCHHTRRLDIQNEMKLNITITLINKISATILLIVVPLPRPIFGLSRDRAV